MFKEVRYEEIEINKERLKSLIGSVRRCEKSNINNLLEVLNFTKKLPQPKKQPKIKGKLKGLVLSNILYGSGSVQPWVLANCEIC
jgi:hypothetical protein